MKEESARAETWRMAVILIAAIVVMIAGVTNALLSLSSRGNPLSDNDIYQTDYGPTTSVSPGRNSGDSWISGFPVHPYSVIHLWVNSTGQVFIKIADPVGSVLQETYAPCNFSCFATIGGSYEVTIMVSAANVTVTETFDAQRLPMPASQSDLEHFREAALISIILIGISSAVSMVSIALLLVGNDRRKKAV
jgi:hypothetical protein